MEGESHERVALGHGGRYRGWPRDGARGRAGPSAGRGGGAAGPTAGSGKLIGGTLTPATPDARGWGWQVKEPDQSFDAAAFLQQSQGSCSFKDKQITSYTDCRLHTPDLYCEVGKHFDYIWFEMQHSTMSFDEVRRMILACPGVGRRADDSYAGRPRVEHPKGHGSGRHRHHRTHGGDDALEARDAARFSRYPPFGRRSSGRGIVRGRSLGRT